MKKIIALTAIVMLAAAPAMAGNKTLKNTEGAKLRINCANSGCKVTEKKPGGKWVAVEKIDGGVDNFKVLVAKYKDLGYN